MKNVILFLFGVIILIGCRKEPFVNPPVNDNTLKIEGLDGIKLQTPFVTNEVAMNVKIQNAQNVTVKIFDISNRVVSKEQMYLNSGDNILKVYTTTLPPSAYRIGLYDVDNRQLGITDFNKL